MIPTLTRLIRGKIAPGKKPVQSSPGPKDIQSIRAALLQCMEDCESVPAQRLRHKIAQTKTAQELWLLRNDAYQLISQQTSQNVAAHRINDLMAVFDGFIEPRQLVRIK